MAISNPQDRYDTPMDTRKTSTGKAVYRSLLPKTLSENQILNVELKASITTRMDRLASEMLDSAFNWWKIANVNNKIDGSLYFSPGTKIKLPTK